MYNPRQFLHLFFKYFVRNSMSFQGRPTKTSPKVSLSLITEKRDNLAQHQHIQPRLKSLQLPKSPKHDRYKYLQGKWLLLSFPSVIRKLSFRCYWFYLTSSVISKRRVRPTMLLAKVGTDFPYTVQIVLHLPTLLCFLLLQTRITSL